MTDISVLFLNQSYWCTESFISYSSLAHLSKMRHTKGYRNWDEILSFRGEISFNSLIRSKVGIYRTNYYFGFYADRHFGFIVGQINNDTTLAFKKSTFFNKRFDDNAFKLSGGNFDSFFAKIPDIKVVHFILEEIMKTDFIIYLQLGKIHSSYEVKSRQNIIDVFRDNIFPFCSFCFAFSLIEKSRKIP